MSDNGLSLWLIPSEIFEVNYGQAIRQYLLDKVDLVRIHFFEQSNVKFDDALVSSCVVVFRHGEKSSNKVEISCGDSMLKPSVITRISREELASKNKWSKRMAIKDIPDRSLVGKKSFMLGDFFEVKRGIATGDNNFFILEKSMAQSLEIPKKYLRNILPSSRYILNGTVDLDEDGFLKTEKKLVMLDIDLPLLQIQQLYPKLFDYLQRGIVAGVDKKYLTSRRKPWYSQEKRQPPDYFIRYMTRERGNSGAKSLMIVNQAGAVATNSYLLLYRKKQTTLESQLYRGEILVGLIERLSENLSHLGRTYGGGLVKFEPGELKKVSFQI
jgi:hypothetical protein